MGSAVRLPDAAGWEHVSSAEGVLILRTLEGDAVRFIEARPCDGRPAREAFAAYVRERGADLAALVVPEPVLAYAPAHLVLLADVPAGAYARTFVLIQTALERLAVLQIARAETSALRGVELREFLRDLEVDGPACFGDYAE
jgi:hypothetical protein